MVMNYLKVNRGSKKGTKPKRKTTHLSGFFCLKLIHTHEIVFRQANLRLLTASRLALAVRDEASREEEETRSNAAKSGEQCDNVSDRRVVLKNFDHIDFVYLF